MKLVHRLRTARPLLIALLAAFLLHAWAVILLPQDFDEPVYLQNAFDYANALRTGGLPAVIDYAGNAEHPPLVKLLYAGGILALGEAASWENALFLSRAMAALFGLLTVILLALFFDPWAAAMLAVHTLAVKYTSQAYLEALPQAMSLLAILAFRRVEKGGVNRWFWLSAAALGLTAAGKYSYLPVSLIVLGYLAIFEKKISFGSLLAYAGAAALTFFAADPSLWRAPLPRLIDSLSFHIGYAQGAHVQEVGYPWYQPFVWLFTSPAVNWHPNVFFYPGLDGVFTLLAVLDLKRAWREQRYLVVWFAAGVVFLLLWPTKWPQYTLTVTPAIVLLAARTLHRIVAWIREKEETWGYLQGMFPQPGKWFWLMLGAFVAFVAVLYLSTAIQLMRGRVGWSNLNRENSPLPSNTVNALLPLPEGKILIGTDRGAALWSPPTDAGQPAEWTLFDGANSGLPSAHITALAWDADGALWFGTSAGVSRFDSQTWQTFTAATLRLENDQILSLAACNNGLYAGSASGAAFFDGAAWHPIEYANGPVFALACRDEELWIALPDGAWHIFLRSGQADFHLTEAVIRQFLFDSGGTLWAATSGAGLARWNGQGWDSLTPANSGLPHLTVNALAEEAGGALWIGTAFPAAPGGAPVRWEGETWRVFRSNNSGASGDEVTAIAIQNGQVWLGTASSGIDIYQLGRTK